MKAKIDALLSSYPSIDINAMGFPVGGRTSRCGNEYGMMKITYLVVRSYLLFYLQDIPSFL